MNSYTVTRFIKGFLLNLLLTAGALIMLTPLLWMLSTALSPNSFLPRATIFPDWDKISFDNFVKAWYFPSRTSPGVTMGTFFTNSLIMTVCITIGGIFVDSMAGYIIARKQFPGRMLFTYMALATLMVPFYVTVIPQYLIVRGLGWMNSFAALIVPFLASGMGIYLFRSHFLSVPIELEECAKLDGASDFRIYFSVILPISKPIIGTMAVLKSMWSWNQFLWPLIVMTDTKMKTIQQGLTIFQGLNITEYGYLCAGMAIAIAPLLIVFFCMQNYFIGGLTAGAVKG